MDTASLAPYIAPLHTMAHNLAWLAPLLALALFATVAFGWHGDR